MSSKHSSVLEATGAAIRPQQLLKNNYYHITDFGAGTDKSPVENTNAIHAAIHEASLCGGGTIVFPAGTFYVYTIVLKDNINLFLEDGAVVAAAKTDIASAYEPQYGEGGNYEEPEVNLYAGLQDHGHTYFANSLVYGVDLKNIMIYGNGLFTGGRLNEDTGILEYVLQGGDPIEPVLRTEKGHNGVWYGNKGIALVRCENVVFQDFSITIGGHFAIITEGCKNLYVDHILVDTTRDAFDIDCCQDVTVWNTTCNSLTDDGLCLKASFGAGLFMPVKNVLIEDCIVSGYDAGSVYAGEYTRDKLVAEDRCGPTARVKFGTEATCGYHQVTIRRVKFDRSRGFALEATDCSSLTDVLFTDCTMDDISSSPIFIRAGERCRFPVTGNSADKSIHAKEGNVRIDNPNWVLPNTDTFARYPAKRYSPHYNRTRKVTVDNCSFFDIIDESAPTGLNPANYYEKDGHYYAMGWDEEANAYLPDFSKEIPEKNLPLYANGIGTEQMAAVENIEISNLKVTNADPRYPVLLMGLTDSHLKNITLRDIQIEYRGGLTMEHAVEQRQLNTSWKYSQFHASEHIQSLPWLVNTFFSKNEGLLPRVQWDTETECWKENPYNIPELPEIYPEPSNWGILPAYGIFAKHIDNLTLENITFTTKVPDLRHVCVLDDARQVTIRNMQADCDKELSPIVSITNHYRRHTNAENVPMQPYFTTTVSGLTLDGISTASSMPLVQEIAVTAPAPGTPTDALYPYPTVPCQETGYTFRIPTDEYPLPLTVFRPYFVPLKPITAKVGQDIAFSVAVRNPASQVSAESASGIIHNEFVGHKYYGVKGQDVSLTLSCDNLPDGASFKPETGAFYWCPSASQAGTYALCFLADDGLIPEKGTVTIHVIQ